MLKTEDNEMLVRVGPKTPMGDLMRMYWLPFLLSGDVPVDGQPYRVRLLGEDLVAFRDSNGRIGLVDQACPHRGAPMVFARNEEGGLRCLYHGWKMDVKGNVIEMVSEPAASCLAAKVKHKAYPVQEWGGFVWAYLGPKETQPEFVPPRWAPTARA